ncbi:MAG: ribosome maturation factor RimM [Desulfomonile sp.]|nr:ribosome maturation factor RimM [Desulfomonile sp.]
MSADTLVVIGEAVKAFGIRGELKIKPFTESFEAFDKSSVLVVGDTPYRLLSVRFHKGAALALLEGVDTPEKARELVGSLVKTASENLPDKEENEYYWFELIGMTVVTNDGRSLGKVTRIIETGANDVLEVEGPFGDVLIPMIDDVVLDVDTEKKKMIVDPLEGLIPDG